MMRVAMLAFNGEFRDSASAGNKFYRYPHMLYTLMKKNKRGISVDGLEAKRFSSIGKSVSMFSQWTTYDFSKYDIVHSIDVSPLFPARKGKALVVTTAHDFQFITAPEYNVEYDRFDIKSRIWQNYLLNFSIKSMLLSDYIIAVSTQTKKDAVKLGFDKSKVFVVNHGLDQRFFSPVKKKKNKQFTVGYVGGISVRKNLAFAIRAFKMIKKPGYKFDVFGGKFWYDEPYEIAKSDKRITFKGYVPDNKIVSAYDSLDVFVLPTYYEGFSIPVIEAQARGLPVILYKKGIVPEESRKYCFEAKDEENMAQIIMKLKENGYNDKIRKKAMQYARSFTWQKTVDKTIDVYEKITSK